MTSEESQVGEKIGKTFVERLRMWEAVLNSGLPKMGAKMEGLQQCSCQSTGGRGSAVG